MDSKYSFSVRAILYLNLLIIETSFIGMNQSILHFFPAEHGDAFIMHCFKGKHEGYLVIDGGPKIQKSANFITKQIEQLPSIDLMILTHHDDDHIGGLLHYIKKHRNDVPFPLHSMWVNCARWKDFSISTNLSSNQANKLADILIEIEKESSIQWKDYMYVGSNWPVVPFADFQCISPTKEIFNQYIVEYQKQVSQPPISGINLAAQRSDDINIDLETLAARPKDKPNLKNYQQLANAASMAFVIECDGLSVLMLGDSFPHYVVPCLKKILEQRRKEKLKVDYVKISHHGSRNNTNNELLDLIDCNNYIISTNGGHVGFKHPDRETLANILCHGGRNKTETIHFYFNHSINSIQRRIGALLFKNEEKEQYNFVIHEPNELTIANGYRIDKY